ncbi:MAG: hypothetical protein LKM36_05350 [Flavobacteriales bacterium]|jgi:hypothetical protein|nr:hypothetical protein [Flavobacteriales bacterium]MBP9160056.1 hypothetical protein [Flavobacteriales bacterium]MCI1752301.1 hypothetical protein [Flavobacteriales bacterium]
MIRGVLPVAVPALLCALAVAGCGRQVDSASLHTVNVLSHRIDSLQGRLAEMDTASLLHMSQLFTAEREGIELRFKDTLGVAEAGVLGNYYRAMGGTLPRVLDERLRLRALLTGSAKRLLNLQHDLCTGHITTEQAANALRVENQWCDRLTEDMRMLTTEAVQLQKDRTQLRAEAVQFLHP